MHRPLVLILAGVRVLTLSASSSCSVRSTQPRATMHRLRAKRHASPAPSTRAPSFPESNARSTPVAEGSRGKKRVKTSLNYLIPAPKITKEMSSICPQLQLALGALIKILETYKVRLGSDSVRRDSRDFAFPACERVPIQNAYRDIRRRLKLSEASSHVFTPSTRSWKRYSPRIAVRQHSKKDWRSSQGKHNG